MQIEIFTICDNVQVYAGKAVVVGAYNQLRTKQLPVVIPSLAMVLRVAFEKEEAGDKIFDFKFLNPDNSAMMPDLRCEAKINAPEGKTSLLTTLDMNMVFNNIKLEQFGLYSVVAIHEGSKYVFKFSVEEEK